MHQVALIRQAIEEKKQVVAYYDSHRRELCPHVLGTSKGKYRCLFFQFGGETSKGRIGLQEKPDWKCMDLDKLTRIELLEGPWHTERGPRRTHQHCIDTVLLQVRL